MHVFIELDPDCCWIVSVECQTSLVGYCLVDLKDRGVDVEESYKELPVAELKLLVPVDEKTVDLRANFRGKIEKVGHNSGRGRVLQVFVLLECSSVPGTDQMQAGVQARFSCWAFIVELLQSLESMAFEVGRS